MNSFKDAIIKNVISGTKSKEDIYKKIKELENIDVCHNLALTKHIFKFLLVNSTPEDKEIMNNIWDNSDMWYKKILKYDIEKSSYGRELVSKSFPDKDVFEMLAQHGTLIELKKFLENKEDFFKKEEVNFNFFRLNYKKLLMCSKKGLDLTPSLMLASLNKLKSNKIHEGYEFFLSQKDKFSPDEWDTAMSTLLRASWDYKDSFILIEQMYNPKNYCITQVQTNFKAQNTFNSNQLSEAQYQDRWLEVLPLLNTDKIFFTNTGKYFLNKDFDDIVFNAIDKTIDRLILNKYDKIALPNFSGWPLSNGFYNTLLTEPKYYNRIIDHIYEKHDSSTFKTILDAIQRKNNLDPYIFFFEQNKTHPFKGFTIKEIIKQNLSNQFNEDIYFKKMLDFNLNKKDDRKRMKI